MVPHEELSHTLNIEKAGYVYIYLSNEEGANSYDVFFDDFTVTHTHTPIVQKDDYYPFGLTFNSYTSGTENLFKYNGFEEQEEIGLYDYQARFYDPAIGRFINVDPAADFMRRHSPYNYAFDNPIKYTDPDGMWPENPLFNAGLAELKAQYDYVANKVEGAVDNTSEAISNGASAVAETVKDGAVAVGEAFESTGLGDYIPNFVFDKNSEGEFFKGTDGPAVLVSKEAVDVALTVTENLTKGRTSKEAIDGKHSPSERRPISESKDLKELGELENAGDSLRIVATESMMTEGIAVGDVITALPPKYNKANKKKDGE